MARCREFGTLLKANKTPGFATVSKHWQAWDVLRGPARLHVHGKRCTRDMLIRAVKRSGRRFLEMDCNLEHHIFRFAKMILHDRCSTGNDLASLFHWQAEYSSQVEWTNCKTHWHEAVSSAVNFSCLKAFSQSCSLFECCPCKNLQASRRLAFCFSC